MISSAPTILALETDSAWLVIPAVCLVTLVASFVARKAIGRTGGVASGILLSLPLVLPVVAAMIYNHAVLPEVSVLQPAGTVLVEKGEQLLHLLRVGDGTTQTFVPYAMTGSAGPWLVLFGVGVTLFMLVRRVVGMVMVRRLVNRCREPLAREEFLLEALERVTNMANTKRRPPVLILPPGYSGAFAVGARRSKILISTDLLYELDNDELEAVLAHEVAHIQSRDLLVVSAAGFLRDAVAWNPFAHVAHSRLVADREFEADRRAAAITGNPLAVASGLLKMFELVRSRKGVRQRTALAFLHRGAGISRRVTGLIAVADGRVSVTDAGRAPFALAGLLVALLGLQVGAQMAEDRTSFAIVWGDTASPDGELWQAPKKMRGERRALAREHAQAVAQAGQPVAIPRPIRYPELSSGIRVHEADVDSWLSVVDKSVTVSGLRSMTLTWETRHDWKATPLFEAPATGVPIGIYRLDQDL